MIEPSPGVANWLITNAVRALARLGALLFKRRKQSFVGDHHGGNPQGEREEHAYTTQKQSVRMALLIAVGNTDVPATISGTKKN